MNLSVGASFSAEEYFKVCFNSNFLLLIWKSGNFGSLINRFKRFGEPGSDLLKLIS